MSTVNCEQVDWYMEKPPSANTNSDMCVASSFAKTVTRADQAFFKTTMVKLDAVVMQTDFKMDIVLIHCNESGDPTIEFANMIKDRAQAHAIFPINLTCLVPMHDIDDKLAKEVKDKQSSIEKTMKKLGQRQNMMKNACVAKSRI